MWMGFLVCVVSFGFVCIFVCGVFMLGLRLV